MKKEPELKGLWVSVDLCVVPLGVGVSLAPFIGTCQKVIEGKGLDYELGPNGTAIEGYWEEVFDCIKDCHLALHDLEVPRIYTTLKINTRNDRRQSFHEKVPKVKTYL